ncbi:DUF3313 domain-containing protein [Pantoea sp. FN060301]|uniref:DUF3313 domain-containing protein n=1 Tax=Pantoea sp. FN060301 TaxID=3420380 RepID=UPI003D17366C
MFICKRVLAAAGAALMISTLTNCASETANESQYSGFLNSYSHFQPVKTESGHETLRWISPDYQSDKYTSVYFSPVVYYPRPRPDSRVSASTLELVRLYTERQLKNAESTRHKLSDRPQPGGLIIKTAITAVTAENENVQFYEVVPVAAVLAGTMAVTGHRSQDAELFLEAEAIDVSTNQPVVKVIRKGYGKTVSNSSAPITVEDVKSAIDDMVKDVMTFPVH